MSNSIAADRESSNKSRIWSLSWQAAVGREFFGAAALAERIRYRLLDAHQRSGRVLVDFLLLPTEIHAIAQIRNDDSVVGVARSFGNVVSRWVRAAQPIRSPVLAGPYRAQVFESDIELPQEVRMLAWRPVHLKACTTATHYTHGGLRAALGLTPAHGFNARPLLSYFGESIPISRLALRTFIARKPTAQEWREWELSRGLELATDSGGQGMASAKTVSGAAAVLIAAGGGYGVQGALELFESWVGAKLHPAAPPDLQDSSSIMAARGRALVACLAVTHNLCSAASVARYFRRTKSTLSEQMAVCRLRPADRVIITTPLRRIVEESALLMRPANSGLLYRTTRSVPQNEERAIGSRADRLKE